MRLMFADQVVPRLRGLGWIDRVFVHRKISLFGKGESDVEADALDLTARGHVPEVGITVHDATISFRIRGEGPTAEEAWRQTDETVAQIRQRFGPFVLGEGATDVADALVAELARTGASLATAESCTGGLVAHLITAIPGVSPYYPGGVVTYSNQAKTELLDVPAELIEAHGAVSPEVAVAMARGVLRRFDADVAVSATGVAGPGGGTPDKPVGLVYLGLATRDLAESRRLEMGPEQPRDVIQSRSSKQALNWVRLTLQAWPDKGVDAESR
jgi:nicotinamide-nucleotide amidase